MTHRWKSRLSLSLILIFVLSSFLTIGCSDELTQDAPIDPEANADENWDGDDEADDDGEFLDEPYDEEDDFEAYANQAYDPDSLSQGAGKLPSAPQDQKTLGKDERVPQQQVNGVAVSTSHPLATQAAMEILAKGGNAVDAAITVSLVLAVVEPFASGLGGSGAMLMYDAKSDSYNFLDYRAAAGLAEVPSGYRGLIGIPGLIHGLGNAHKNFGTLTWKELVEPAYNIAQMGFIMNVDLERAMNRADTFLYDNPAFVNSAGQLKHSGDIFIQEELAQTLATLMNEGPESFYSGTIAQQICDVTGFDLADMQSYQSYYRDPVSTEFAGSRFIASPPPYSGITILQMLRMAELLGTGQNGLDPDQYLKDLERITLVAYDRHRLIVGDPQYIKFNPDKLLSDEYLQKHLAKDLTQLRKNPSTERCTTHFSILDREGNVVSATNTLTSFWGSTLKVGGFYLNDTLSNFSNNKRNSYHPLARPRSFITPMIVEGGDGSRYGIGTPGGQLIPKLLFPIFCDHYLFGNPLDLAVNRQRFFFKGISAITIEQDKELLPKWELNFAPYFLTQYGFHGYFGAVEIAGHHADGSPFAISDFRRQGLAQVK